MCRRLAEGTWPGSSSSAGSGAGCRRSTSTDERTDDGAVLVAMVSERGNEDERPVCAVIRLSPALGRRIHLLHPPTALRSPPPDARLRPARQTLGDINHNRAAVSSHSHRGSESPAQPGTALFSPGLGHSSLHRPALFTPDIVLAVPGPPNEDGFRANSLMILS